MTDNMSTDPSGASPADPATPPPTPRTNPRMALVLSIGVVVFALLAAGVFILANRSKSGSDADGTPTIVPGWQRRDSIHTPRDDFGTLLVGDRVWIGGGMTGDRGNKLNTTEWYDPAKNTWTLGTPMPTARSSLGVALLDNVIYAIGGATLTEPYLHVNEAYDVTAGTWKTLAPMPTARYEIGTVTLDGKIWTIGGRTPDGPSDVVEIYDPATDTWSDGPSLHTARSSLRAAVFNGKIYAIGGLIVNGSIDVVEIYDPATGEWSDGPSLPTSLSNFGLTVYDNQLHVIYHQYHLVLGSEDTRWRMEEAPPIKRHGLGLVNVDGVLYAIGGCTETPLADINVVQAWTPPVGSVTSTPPPDQTTALAAIAAAKNR